MKENLGSLLSALNREELLSLSRAERASRETLTNQRNGQSPIVGSSTRESAGFCMWEGARLDVWADWGMRLRAAAGRDLGVLVHGKLNMRQQCPGSQEGHLCPGALGKAFLVR